MILGALKGDKIIVFKPKYSKLFINSTTSFGILTILFSLIYFKNHDYGVWIKFLKLLLFLTFGYVYVIFFQFKTIVIGEEKIVIIRRVLQTKNIINLKDIDFIKEHRFLMRAGLDHLLITSNGNKKSRLFCNYICDYSKMYKEIFVRLKNINKFG